MLQFLWPWVFAVLPLPLLMLWLPKTRQIAASAALRLPFFDALGSTEQPHRGRRALPLLLAVLVWLLLVTATARPQWIGDSRSVLTTGRDLMLAVDLSGSMRAKDMQEAARMVARIQVVRRVGKEFIRRREGDRVGLIVFASRAYLQAPLTLDRNSVGQMLAETVLGLAGDQTAIGDAIGLAVKHLRELPAQSRVLVLLTDGADNASEVSPLQAAEYAAALGIRIYTIGVGANEIVRRNLPGIRSQRSRANPDLPTLEAIAKQTNGRYFHARDANELEAIYALIDALEPTANQNQGFRPIIELFHWPLGIAWIVAFMLMLVPILNPYWQRLGVR